MSLSRLNYWLPRDQTDSAGFCRKVRFLGQNPKIGCQEFNDLQTHKLSKKQLCDRTFPSPLERRPGLLWRSASRVPHSAWSSGHLCHFPLYTALPCALVGRDSHEYYWHSVTLELALRRPSRVPSQRNVSRTT